MGSESSGGLAIVAGLAALWYFDPFGWVEKTTYRAEVGYYLNDQQAWYVGPDKSREDCTKEAIARYNSINAEHPKRAFSWACRKMVGERFEERVR